MTLALAILLGAAGPALAQDAEADAAEAAEALEPDLIYEAVFEDAMYVEKDIMLHGLTGYGNVSFSMPRGWELAADPELVLRYAHSGELIPGQSSLTALVNDVPVATVELNAENAAGGELVAVVPRGVLDEYNTVTFAGVHKRTESCQDPYDMSLWTRIAKDSLIRFPVRRVPVDGELLEYPYPLFDELGFGPMRLTWVAGPGGRSPQSLTAAGHLALGLGRLADYRGVEMAPPVERVEDASSHALMVGTVSEIPQVSELVDTSTIKDDQGLVAILPNPADPKKAVLVVTSHTDRGLMSAVSALNSNTRLQTLSGPSAVTSNALDDRLPESRQEPLPVAGFEAAVSDLGLEDATVRGYYAPQFRVPIVLEGDAAIRPEGGVARIDYAYSAGLDTRLSTIEVRLNGVTLRSAPLNERGGEQDATLRVRLPPEVVEPHSYLDVVFHLFPEGYDACEWRPDETHWATLYASSEIEIPRDRYAMMPDLSRLRYRGWPFNLEAGPVTLVVADDPRPLELSAMFQLAAQLGAWGTAERPSLEILTATAADKSVGQHRVLLVSDSPHPYFNSLVNQKRLSAPGEVGGRGLRGRKGAAHGYMEQIQDGDYTLMALRSSSQDGLMSLVNALADSRILAKLDDNLVVLTEGGIVQTYETAPKVQVGEIPLSTQARLLLQRHWATWGLFAVLGAMVFAGMVRGWAARRGGEV